MKQVLQNPFRILGLPVSATDRQIAKRVMEAETYLEMGKPLKVEGDFPWLPPVTRTPDAIKEAQGRLHRLEDRCYHAMFWFHTHDSVDQLALDVLQDGNVEKAIALWTKQPTVSNLINLYVLHFALDGTQKQSSEDPFFKGLIYAGKAFNAEGLEAFHRKINWDRFDSDKIIQDIEREALNRISGSTKLVNVAGREIRQVFSAIAHFPPSGRTWMEDRFVDDYRECLERAIQNCKSAREAFPEDSPENAQELLNTAKPLLEKLRYVIKLDDPRLAILSDQVGNEILQCGIDYHNYVMAQDEDEELPLQPSVTLVEIAANFSSGPILKGRIRDNLPILTDHAENQEIRRQMGGPIKEVFRLLEDLPKIDQNDHVGLWSMPTFLKIFLQNVKIPLLELRQMVGATNTNYLEVSSLVVQVSLSQIIKYGSDDVFLEQYFNDTMRRVIEICDALETFDMDSNVRERLDSNRQIVLRNLKGRSAPATPQPPGDNSSCYIATCVYGDSMAPQVVELRRFRDERLHHSCLGRAFIACYYFVSPWLAQHLARFPRLHAPIRRLLDGLILRWRNPSDPSRRNPAC